MNQNTYSLLENYMLSCMDDSAHDKEHIYRVLYNALEIAKTEQGVDYDVLIAACLLHDIGRKEQFENPALCHAAAGAEKAFCFLTEHGFAPSFAGRVKDCIRTHRYRKNNQPESIEAKILFDADKIDVAGAIGIARTLIYKGIVGEPLYSVLPDGTVSDGENDTAPSFFREYRFKLEKIYSGFYTARGREIATDRRKNAEDFYRRLYEEVSAPYENGKTELQKILRPAATPSAAFRIQKASAADGTDIYEMLQQLPAEENGFLNTAAGITFEEYKTWLKHSVSASEQVGILDGWKVPSTTYWFYENNVPVGFGKLRHQLTDALRESGGNVGYSIIPSARNRGLAKRFLAMMADEAKKLGMEELLLTIHNDNLPSIHVALANGGRMLRRTKERSYIHIDIRDTE